MIHRLLHNSIHSWIKYFGFLALIVWFSYSFMHGERVWARDGIGWDGAIYADMAINFQENIQTKQISKYYIQHSFPSAIIYYSTQLFGFKIKSNSQVISAFLIYQYLLLLISFAYIRKIANHLAFSIQIKYILFSSIFLIFPVLKKFTYIPISTEISALSIGVIIFYYFLKKNYLLLYVAAIIGIFIFPSMIYTSFILLVIPQVNIDSNKKMYRYNWGLKILLMFIFAVLAYSIVESGFQSKNYSKQIEKDFFILSLACILYYIYKLLNPISFFLRIKKIPYKLYIKQAIIGISFLIIAKVAIHFLGNNEASALKSAYFFRAIIYGSIVLPFVSLVSHIAYFGPLIFIIIIFWKSIYREIQKLGLPILVFVGLYLFMSLSRESRQFINAWPVFVIGTCIYLNKFKVSWKFVYMFIIFSLIFSKFWFIINIGEFTDNFNMLDFPQQRFFMMNGPWLGSQMYILHLVVEIILFICFYLFLKKEEVFIKTRYYSTMFLTNENKNQKKNKIFKFKFLK